MKIVKTRIVREKQVEAKYHSAMSQEIYSCIDLLQATEAEKKGALDQLKASAKKYAAQNALKSVWQTDIGGISRAVMEDGNANFALCKRVVVERVEQSPKTAAQKNAEFLAKVAEGELASWNAQRAAGDTPESIQYTFQPVLKAAPYHRYNNPW
jgi:hypothetical protein